MTGESGKPPSMDDILKALAGAGDSIAKKLEPSLDDLKRDLALSGATVAAPSIGRGGSADAAPIRRRPARQRGPRRSQEVPSASGGIAVADTNQAPEGMRPNGPRKLEEEVNFSNVDREALKKDIQERTDYRGKLLAVRKSLSALGGICREVSDRQGWSLLAEAVKDLPKKNLIDQVYWKQRFDWTDKQLDALNANKQDELVSPKELEDLFLLLHELLVESQKVLFTLRQHPPETPNVPERQRISFPGKLDSIQALADEWEALHQKIPEFRHGDFHVAINDALNPRKGLIIVPEFLAWIKEQEAKHHWKGEESKEDKRIASVQLSILKKMVAMAKEKLPEFEEKSDRQKDAGEDKQTAPPVSSARPTSSGAGATSLAAPAVSSDTASALPVASPEKKRRPLRDIAQVEKHLEMLKRKDEEIRYRDSMENLYLVRPTRNNEVFELWYPDKRKLIKHFREIAQEIYGLDLAFEGQGPQGGDASDVYYDPMLKDLSPDAIKQRGEGAEGVLRRKTGEARIELEKDLEAKLKLIAEQMNEMLLQEEPGLSYSKRRGRILGQLPEFAEMVLKLPKHAPAALSPDEREALIEKHTQSITIQR